MKITYNKRKRGLLKKMVELSVMCGVKAKLEIKDSFGNLIVLDAGEKESHLQDKLRDKVFVFTPADVPFSLMKYPDFKGFERTRRKNPGNDSSDVPEEQSESVKAKPVKELPEEPSSSQTPGIHELQRANTTPLYVQDQPPISMAPSMPQNYQSFFERPYLNPMGAMQDLQLQSQLHSQLQYAQMRYQSMLNSFLNGNQF